MKINDKDVLFIGDTIEQTKTSINSISGLGCYYKVHPYTLSHGFIKSSSIIGAAAATTIFNFNDEFDSKHNAAEKVIEIFTDELLEIILEVDKRYDFSQRGISH